MNNKKPSYDKVGIAYMLAGDAPISNITPAGKKEDGDWVEGLKAHLMILVSDQALRMLETAIFALSCLSAGKEIRRKVCPGRVAVCVETCATRPPASRFGLDIATAVGVRNTRVRHS